jgi:hypothetical protein
MRLSENQIRLAAEAVPAVAPVAKTLLNNRLQMRAMERQKEAEIELVEAKQNVEGDAAPSPMGLSDTSDPSESVEQQTDDAFAESIEAMKRDEECDLCARLLDGFTRLDRQDRPVALAEYGRFKQAVDDTEDVDAIRDEISRMTVLEDVMVRELNMNPAE